MSSFKLRMEKKRRLKLQMITSAYADWCIHQNLCDRQLPSRKKLNGYWRGRLFKCADYLKIIFNEFYYLYIMYHDLRFKYSRTFMIRISMDQNFSSKYIDFWFKELLNYRGVEKKFDLLIFSIFWGLYTKLFLY